MRFLLSLFLLPLFSPTLSAQETTLSVLGTVHLHNPGNDAINADMGDILSPQKQAELQAAISAISNYQPTKIAFEWVTNDTLWSRYYYRAWREGRLEDVIDPEDRFYLTSEIVQLAYPLAKAAGLDELHPIDFHNGFPLDSALTWAAANGQQAEVDDLQQLFVRAQSLADSMGQLPIIETLRICNSAYFSRNLSQRLYLDKIVALGIEDNYAGSHVVEEWYRRNVRIFTNLTRITKPGDRVLIIFGAGHKEILDDLIQDRADWRWVDGAQLLGKVKK